MNKTFVCGDIHGNLKALLQVLEKCSFDPEKDMLITLGDYIDGGAHIEVRELFEYLLNLPNWIGIIGNHDYWMIETLESGWSFIQDEAWLDNGGIETLGSLCVELKRDGEEFSFTAEAPEIVKDFCKRLKLYHIMDNKLFVHAGYDYASGPIEEQDSSDILFLEHVLWDRAFWRKANKMNELHYDRIYVGHTWNEFYPEKRNKVWNLDSGAGHYGRLTIMDVDTEQYWQSDRTPQLYPNFSLR
jgi:serine/threonine protein phosphatase 1